MSTYKYLVVTDLDGTLLNDSGHVSPETLKYVQELKKRKDVLFTFSTGRTWRDAERVYKLLDLKGFVSLFNGARYYLPSSDTSVCNFISQNIWEPIMSNDIFYENLILGDIYTDKWEATISADSDKNELMQRIKDTNANVYAFKMHYNQPSVEEENYQINRKLSLLKSFDENPYLTLYNYKPRRLLDIEIHAPHANKNKAVEFFSAYYGIHKSNIITLGDQINDLPAAHGDSYFVAVSNAVEFLRLSADKVSEFNNNEDCVIKEVEMFLNARECKK